MMGEFGQLGFEIDPLEGKSLENVGGFVSPIRELVASSRHKSNSPVVQVFEHRGESFTLSGQSHSLSHEISISVCDASRTRFFVTPPSLGQTKPNPAPIEQYLDSFWTGPKPLVVLRSEVHHRKMDTTSNTSNPSNPSANEHWDEVGSLLTGLGLKLQLHVEQAASADKDGVTDALRSLGESLEHAFEGLRAASTDVAIRDDVKNVARTLSEAVSKTLTNVEADIRKAVKTKS
jgi:hypothetical protein